MTDDSPKTYTSQQASQGQTVLRHRWSRAIFIGALAAIVLLVLMRALAGLG